jgi:hypothetical protein
MAITLEEFLVSIKYAVDAGSQHNFLEGLKHIAESSLGLKLELLGLGTAVWELTKHFAELGATYYWMAQRIGSSASEIRSTTFALSQLGMTQAQAQQAIESFNSWQTRYGGASLGFLRSLGVTATDTSEQMVQLADVFKRMGGDYAHMHGTPAERNQFALARQIAEMIFGPGGMQTMLSLTAEGAQAIKEFNDWSERMNESVGLGKKGMEEYGQAAHKVGWEFGKITHLFNIMQNSFGAELMPRVLSSITHLVDFLSAHLKEITTVLRVMADVVAVIFRLFTDFIEVGTLWLSWIGKAIVDFRDLLRWLGIGKEAFIAFFGYMSVLMLSSPFGRWITALTFIISLLQDYLRYTHGAKDTMVPWGEVEKLGKVKDILRDIVVLLGTIMLLGGPKRVITGLASWIAARIGLGALFGGGAAGAAGAAATAAGAGAATGAAATGAAATGAAAGAGGAAAAGTAAATTAVGGWSIGAVLSSFIPLAKLGAIALLVGTALTNLLNRINDWLYGPGTSQGMEQMRSGGESLIWDALKWLGNSIMGTAHAETTQPGVGAGMGYTGPGTTTRTGNTIGDRNLNFGNLTALPGQPHEGRFRTFKSWEEGVGASLAQFRRYHQYRGAQTLADYIKIWAPPGENRTGQYIANVAKWAKINPNAVLNLDDPEVMTRVFQAMGRMEGTHAPGEAIRRGVYAAEGGSVPFGTGTVIGGQQPGTKGNATINQTTNIHVASGPDAAATSHRVILAQSRVNELLVRNTAAILR